MTGSRNSVHSFREDQATRDDVGVPTFDGRRRIATQTDRSIGGNYRKRGFPWLSATLSASARTLGSVSVVTIL